MDEEKQSSPGDDKENEPLDIPSDDKMVSGKAEASPKSDDLAMPDMDLPKARADGQQEPAPSADDVSPPTDAATEAAESQDDSAAEFDKTANADAASEENAEAAMLKMMEEEAAGEAKEPGKSPDLSISGESQAVVEKAAFEPLRDEGKGEAKNLDLLLDVSLPIAIELGRTSMAIEDVLNLGPGSVVELDKLAGEPVDLLVNNKLLAKGEVVVIDENFGVRITSMISPQDRIRNLR